MTDDPFSNAEAAFAPPKAAAAAGAAIPARELIKIEEPGVFEMDDESYHADPCPAPSLSSSLAKVLIGKTPRHAYTSHPRLNPNFEARNSDGFDKGKIFHTLMLGKGAGIEAFDAENWTKAGGEGRKFKAACRERGTIPILASHLEKAQEMARAVRAQIPLWEELQFALSGGLPERVLVWMEDTPFGPIWCRAMLDWLPHRGNLFPDWKWTTAGAGPDEWGAKTLWNLDADIQAAFYRRGIKACLGQDASVFFAVAEESDPYALACHRITPAAEGMAMRAVEEAIFAWGLCLSRDRWPGYRNQMSWQDPPPWHERGRLEAEERGDRTSVVILEQLKQIAELPRGRGAAEEGERVDVFGLSPIREKGE